MRFNKNVFISLLVVILSTGCEHKTSENQKEMHPKYNKDITNTQGIRVSLDSIATINTLINRLNAEYQLEETGKAYWIGYTDLMYSIAIHSDNAVQPLLNFIDTTKCDMAKEAGCYTLHLIGINCEIVGRMHENFKNKNARNALLTLLDDYSLQYTVMSLLIRDPWLSDVPRLFEVIEHSDKDCWSICNGLLRYDLKDIPLNRDVPKDISNLKIEVFEKRRGYYEKEFYRLVLSSFNDKYPEQVSIEDTLYNYNYYWKPMIQGSLHEYDDSLEYGDDARIIYAKGKGKVFVYINTILEATNVDYCWLGNSLQYTIEDNKLYIISPTTNKKIWLDWWNSKASDYRDYFKDIDKDTHRKDY